MSVIAKLMVRQVIQYGTGTFVELSCLCDNDLMAAYATTEDDKLFTKYSPWGEMRISQKPDWAVFHKTDEHVEIPKPNAYYVMLLGEDEVAEPTFPAAAAFLKVSCHSRTKFAGDGSRVEFREVYQKPVEPTGRYTRETVIERLSWKMQVDNPPAEGQFVPGQIYWLAFYDANSFDRDATIRAAHGHDA